MDVRVVWRMWWVNGEAGRGGERGGVGEWGDRIYKFITKIGSR